jgi:phage terminase large subunit-like protein
MRKKTGDQDRDFPAIAAQYCNDVLTRRIPACKWVRLACQRQVDDLKRKRFEWHYDTEKAARPCRFIELLPHIKGKWKTALLRLEPWQIFIICTVFGWVDADGNRRFRTVYIEVPRKNAKSTLTSGVALYCLCENEPGAEVYSAATKKDQARIVFEVALRMVRKTPGLARRFGIEVEKHRIFNDDAAKEFKPLSSDEDGLDGLNIHFVSVDELHAHKSRAVWDVLDSATGSRTQPLVWAITTAGSNQQGVCFEQREYVCNLLNKRHDDERYFGVIYSIDLQSKDADGNVIPGDDWKDESAWRKANPNYGVSVLPADIAAIARKAIQSSRTQNNFLTKRLNVWCNASEAYYNLEAWRRCQRDVSLTDFEGEPCWIGLDLSSKVDITAKARVFRRMETDTIKGKQIEQAHYYVFVEHYLPDSVLESDDNKASQQYSEWADAKRITLTPGPAIDYATIQDGIMEDARRFDLQAVGYDPWNTEQMRQQLEAEGLTMVENRMGMQTMSDPMKTSEALILANRLHHDGDPVLTWEVGNVVGYYDNKANVYPRKTHPENKIDGAVAQIIALRLATLHEDSTADLSAYVIG